MMMIVGAVGNGWLSCFEGQEKRCTKSQVINEWQLLVISNRGESQLVWEVLLFVAFIG